MSTAEILAELPRFSAVERALVQAEFLKLVNSLYDSPRGAEIRSPRLAHPAQAKDFAKPVVELVPDTKL